MRPPSEEQISLELHILELDIAHKIEIVNKDLEEVRKQIKLLNANSVTIEAFAPVKKMYQTSITLLTAGILGAIVNELMANGP